MTKNVIFCADGTWNGPGAADPEGLATPSNVQKFFESLAGDKADTALENEMERTASHPNGEIFQVAKYIHGVGDSKNPLVKYAEGSTGAGLMARLVRGYTFISRNYCPGDRIYIIGFSRGAYTARALTGLIVNQGLLNWSAMGLDGSGDTNAYAAGMAAWGKYRAGRKDASEGVLGTLAKVLVEAKGNFYEIFNAPPKLEFVPDVPIKAVGVWDTVGALGIPVLDAAGGARVDVFQFVDCQLSPKVELGFHAVSTDEMRVDFTPTLWDPRDQGGIEQALFPGAHADVGGGYPQTNNESGLSDVALQWMLNRLMAAGVQAGNIVSHSPDPKGMAHRPWAGTIYKTDARHFPPGLSLSQPSLDRVNAGPVPIQNSPPAPYRPSNLANSYYLMSWTGPAPHVEISVT